MSIELVDRSGEMGDSLKQLAERRLEFALSNYEDRIQSVSVVVSDLNGPRGGIDKEVRISVRMKRHGEIIVTDRDNDLAACLSRAAARCGRAVARSVDRIQKPKRQSPSRIDAFDSWGSETQSPTTTS
jgi:ribosome-associated translation inhibitor RaiA